MRFVVMLRSFINLALLLGLGPGFRAVPLNPGLVQRAASPLH